MHRCMVNVFPALFLFSQAYMDIRNLATENDVETNKSLEKKHYLSRTPTHQFSYSIGQHSQMLNARQENKIKGNNRFFKLTHNRTPLKLDTMKSVSSDALS